MTLPTFIIAGAAKCGTSALTSHFSKHRNVFMPDREVYFFDDDELWGLGREWYARNFQHDKPHVIAIGQKTPGLLYLDWTHQRMRQVIPDARLIVLLRNPVDRLYSHWQHACRMSDETPGFEALIKRDLAKSADAPLPTPWIKCREGTTPYSWNGCL